MPRYVLHMKLTDIVRQNLQVIRQIKAILKQRPPVKRAVENQALAQAQAR